MYLLLLNKNLRLNNPPPFFNFWYRTLTRFAENFWIGKRWLGLTKLSILKTLTSSDEKLLISHFFFKIPKVWKHIRSVLRTLPPQCGGCHKYQRFNSENGAKFSPGGMFELHFGQGNFEFGWDLISNRRRFVFGDVVKQWKFLKFRFWKFGQFRQFPG